MLVGDPKQAIYRFRGGKAEQFINISDKNNNQYFPFIEKQVENLKTNFRSFSEVISFNNSFFKFIANEFEQADYKNLYENLSSQKPNKKIGGKVNISFVTNESDENEYNPDQQNNPENEEQNSQFSELTKKYLKKTLQIIQNCLAEGFGLKDMVLLLRNKKEGAYLANYLTENNIKIISSESLFIQNAPEVKFLISLLHYVNNENNLEAKIDWLYYIAKQILNLENIHDFLVEAKSLNYHETELFLTNYNFQISFQNIKNKSLYDTIENLISVFIPEKATQSYVMYFVDLVLERDIKLQDSISDFLTYWQQTGFQKSIPSPEGLDAIKIMTIHKSKGLEFPVVIYPFANEQINSKTKKIWVNLNNENIDIKESLIHKDKNFNKLNAETNQQNQDFEQANKLDVINVLYVALTRAIEQLHIVSSFTISKTGKITNANNISKFFIAYLENQNLFKQDQLDYSFGESRTLNLKTEEKQLEQKVFNQEITSVKQKLNFSAIKIAKKEALIWGTKQKDAIEFGNIIHEIMALIKQPNEIKNALNRSVEKGLIIKNEVVFYEETINQIINHPDLKDFFKPKNIVLNEQSIISKNINSKPDRVEINQNKTYLLDYKTGAHLPKYEIQLNNYQKALEDMNFVVVKKCLVFIADNIKVIHL
jgi:ATP-dependent exoDNAse (exonuclease V) beta subunit